jgi:hypothetical protein
LEALADLKVALADSSCWSRWHAQSLSYFFQNGSELIMGDGRPLLLSMGLSTCPFPSQHQLGWLFGSNLVGWIGDWLFSLNGMTCWLAVKHGKFCGAHLHTPPQKAKR